MGLAHHLLRLYTHLLRLYPPGFRAEFAEEMRDVFALALAEAEQEGAFALVETCLAELRDLPLSLVREHLHERQQKHLALEVVMVTGTPILIYRFCTSTLLAIPLAYGLFVVVPFFAMGLHLQPAELVTGGAFDPGSMPFYITPVGQMIHLIGFCSVFPGLICLPSLNVPLVWI